jgi:D-3-phosphoglycerate dehydrogenase
VKRVLIAESLDEKTLQSFSAKGVEFVYMPNLTPQDLESKIKGFDGLIVRPKPVSAKVIENADMLKLIIRGGAGVNSIALAACKDKGIAVENTPGLNSDATAEFTILLMLQAFAKRQSELSATKTRAGNPGMPEAYTGFELKNKRLGLIGLGNIASRVAKIAEAFGMEVIAYTRSKKDSDVKQVHDLHKLLHMGCDIISLHVPQSDETKNMIGTQEFACMKNATVIINTARPQLIDVIALGAALESGKVGAFAIDGDYDLVKPFIKIDSANKGIITHHIADATYEAQANITKQALSQAVAFFIEGKEINRVV